MTPHFERYFSCVRRESDRIFNKRSCQQIKEYRRIDGDSNKQQAGKDELTRNAKGQSRTSDVTRHDTALLYLL